MPIEIHVNGSATRFWVRTLGANGEIIQYSEDFPSKQKAHKNIVAMLKVYGGSSVLVKEMFGPMKEYFLRKDGTKLSK